MKKIALIITLFIHLGAFSQVTLIKEITSNSTLSSTAEYEPMNYFYTYNDSRLLIYDLNGTIIKEITLPTNGSIASLPYRNVYTSSGFWEYVLITPSSDILLYDERGLPIFDFHGFSPFMIKGDRLIAVKSNTSSGVTTRINRIYQLGGNVSVSSYADSRTVAYPNPAMESITISYSVTSPEVLTITDINGRVVEKKLIMPEESVIQLSVGDYPPGIYIYQYGDTSGKFIIQ